MQDSVVFTNDAHADSEIAFMWYEKNKDGLGWEFRNEIFKTIAKISDVRVNWTKYFNDIRKIRLSRFPYTLYFMPKQLRFSNYEMVKHSALTESTSLFFENSTTLGISKMKTVIKL